MTLIIALVLSVLILAVTVWVVRLIASGPPPEPDLDDVSEVEVNYRCSVCGMRLTVTHAPGRDADPPKHCREEMELLDV